MLDVVDPSKGIWEGELLIALQLTAEKRRQSGKHRHIGRRDILSNEEHSRGHVSIDMVSELSCTQSLDHLDELADLIARHRVTLGEEHVFKVALLGNLKHDRKRVGQTRLFLYDGVVYLLLRFRLDQQRHAFDFEGTESAWR